MPAPIGANYAKQGDAVYLSQTAFIDIVLEKAGLADCNPATIPLGLEKLEPRPAAEGTASAVEKADYASKIGALLWLSRCSRPDISFAVQNLGQFAANPSSVHQAAVKRVLRYLQGTKHFCLQLEPRDQEPIAVWTDADFANCPESRKSITGVAIFVYGCLVSWKSKKQPVIAQSTGEAEYCAIAEGVRDASYVRNLLLELGEIDENYQYPVFCDSAVATTLVNKYGNHGRLKHIEIREHYAREKVAQGQIRVEKIAGTENRAD